MNRYQQSALYHHLQKPNRFHRYRFTSRIRTTDDENSSGFIQGNAERDRWFPGSLIIEIQKRMISFYQVDAGLIGNRGILRLNFDSQFGLGPDEIIFTDNCMPVLQDRSI